MLQARENYRKTLASTGLVYIAGKEREFIVWNLSITGLLGEMEPESDGDDATEVFKAVRSASAVDIYLREMHLAGEASVVRSDLVDSQIYFALEFKSILYDVDNYLYLYKRKAYRKNMKAPGTIEFSGKSYYFSSENVSIEGLMIRIPGKQPLKKGEIGKFDFAALDIRGEARVIWVELDGEGDTHLGLHYEHLQKSGSDGLPVFAH